VPRRQAPAPAETAAVSAGFTRKAVLVAGMGKQSQGRKASSAMTDKQRLNAIRRTLRRMECVLRRPPRWVAKRLDEEALPRLPLAQTMGLAVISRVRKAAGWE
jgi:hypothetical protein